MEQEIIVIRYGHRMERDKRVTTHCCLVARAFGAKEIIVFGDEDKKLAETVNEINENWGGKFSLRSGGNWKKECISLKNKGYFLIHLTMYGLVLDSKMREELQKHKKIAIFIGSQKVPPEIYGLADSNIAIGSQPHSEISALAILLDRLFEGKELYEKFEGEKIRLEPCKAGKKIMRNKRSI